MIAPLSLAGQRFGRLTAVAPTEARLDGRVIWRCLCDCGEEKFAKSVNLKLGKTKTCGKCDKEPSRKTHRPTYGIWEKMRRRCESPLDPAYSYYGGRGIFVCERWRVYENFLADMGERPPGLTLERVNNDMGYSPDNCRWATRLEQQRNRRVNRRLSLNGETKCLSEWADILGINRETLRGRVAIHGWSDEKALTEPVRVESRNSRAKVFS